MCIEKGEEWGVVYLWSWDADGCRRRRMKNEHGFASLRNEKLECQIWN